MHKNQLQCKHCEESRTLRMQASPQKHSSTDAAKDIYLEFGFLDGVMVDCRDICRSQYSSLNSSSVPCDKLSLTSLAEEILDMTAGTGRKDVNCSSNRDIPKQKVHVDGLPRRIIFPNRNAPCMSSLGIHMCDCEDDSLDCNLVTCMVSPLDSKNPKIHNTSRGMKIPDKKDIKENEDKTLWWSSGEKHGNFPGLKAETPSLGSNDGYRQSRRSDFGGKSALAAWAALVSDGPHCSLMSVTGSVGVSPKESSRAANDRRRVPTLASHLELTGTALSLCKLHNDYGENTDLCSPISSTSLQVASTITNSTLKREFTGLKLNPGSLSVSDPAPYGILHGLVHCTLKNGLPNYTFLLDDYEEVVTAKIWMKDTVQRKEKDSWRYSFYSLKGETKKKGKSGWKHWRRKDKLDATLVGKMKISNTLCSDEKQKLSVKSECILFSARLNELAAEAQADVPSQARSFLFETDPVGCKDVTCTDCSMPSTTSASLTTSSDTLSRLSSAVAASAWQSSSPGKSSGLDIVQRSKQVTPKWNVRSGPPSSSNARARTKNASQTLGVTTINASTHMKDSSPESSLSSSNQRHSELAAIIVNMPLETQNRSLINEQHQQASITVILPSGNHGRPLCDLKGPSPLINRWKEGGKCDCKGWDLGCGLMVLCNSSQKPKKCDGNEGRKSQRNEDESESRPLRLYKQDGDQDDAFLNLAPQANGLVALDFHAPLSPLQAFAMAVAILHGRDSNGVLDTHERKPQALPVHTLHYQKDWGGLCADTSNIKEVVNILVNSNQQTPQPQDSLDIPIVKVEGSISVLNRASELALSFERV